MSRSTLEENGWTFHVSHSDMVLYGDICGNDGWFGFYTGSNTGSIYATFKGFGTARLIYGNCWNKNEVYVNLNGKKVSSAYGKEAKKEIAFSFVSGDTIQFVEEGAIIKLHSLTFSCDGRNLVGYYVKPHSDRKN